MPLSWRSPRRCRPRSARGASGPGPANSARSMRARCRGGSASIPSWCEKPNRNATAVRRHRVDKTRPRFSLSWGSSPAPQPGTAMDQLPETILQFGTGKFLRGFADLFIHQANQDGQAVGRVVVVQTTGEDRARLLNEQGGRYHVVVRGLSDGRLVERVED